VRRDHAHFSERRDDGRLQSDARHAVDARIDRKRQQMPEHLPHRQSRSDQVAEVAALPVVARVIDGDAGNRHVAGEERRDRRELVFPGASRESRVGKVGRDLL